MESIKRRLSKGSKKDLLAENSTTQPISGNTYELPAATNTATLNNGNVAGRTYVMEDPVVATGAQPLAGQMNVLPQQQPLHTGAAQPLQTATIANQMPLVQPVELQQVVKDTVVR